MNARDEILRYLEQARDAGTPLKDVITGLQETHGLGELAASRLVRDFVEGEAEKGRHAANPALVAVLLRRFIYDASVDHVEAWETVIADLEAMR